MGFSAKATAAEAAEQAAERMEAIAAAAEEAREAREEEAANGPPKRAPGRPRKLPVFAAKPKPVPKPPPARRQQAEGRLMEARADLAGPARGRPTARLWCASAAPTSLATAAAAACSWTTLQYSSRSSRSSRTSAVPASLSTSPSPAASSLACERRRGEEGTRYRMLVLAAGVGAEHGSVWEARLWAK
jgi:hypothetical protein